MPPETFYSMDYLVFEEAVYQHSQESASRTKALWEMVRFSTATLLRPNLKNQNIPICDIIPLPWDNEEEKIEKAIEKSRNQQAVGVALDAFFDS